MSDRMSVGDPDLPERLSVWRHCKGALYRVIGYSLDENSVKRILYEDYAPNCTGLIDPYNQPVERFLGVHPGLNRPRFERVP